MRPEREIISEHRTTEKEIDTLKLNYAYADENAKIPLEWKIEQKEKDKSRLEYTLRALSETPVTSAKRQNLIDMFQYLIEILSTRDSHGYVVSKSQGMIIPNYVYGCVMFDLMNSFNFDERVGLYHHHYMFETGSTFNPERLIRILEVQHDNLIKMKLPDYPTLKSLHDTTSQEIHELAQLDAN
jgi:hypothetical protein